MAIVLIGMPGSGKTTVGAALARLLQWRFVDTDDMVAAEVGEVAPFIEREGIDAFRARERSAIDGLTNVTGDVVISVGGGAVLDPANRQALAALGSVVWLRAPLATLLERVDDGDGRPLLAGDAEAALARLLHERVPLYESLASVVVDVHALDPNEAAVAIVKEVSAQ